MKSFIILLGLLLIAAGVSAGGVACNSEDEMESFISTVSQSLQKAAEQHGSGINCVNTAKSAIQLLNTNYHSRLTNCINDNEPCCQRQWDSTSGVVAAISQSTMNCILSGK